MQASRGQAGFGVGRNCQFWLGSSQEEGEGADKCEVIPDEISPVPVLAWAAKAAADLSLCRLVLPPSLEADNLPCGEQAAWIFFLRERKIGKR